MVQVYADLARSFERCMEGFQSIMGCCIRFGPCWFFPPRQLLFEIAFLTNKGKRRQSSYWKMPDHHARTDYRLSDTLVRHKIAFSGGRLRLLRSR